MSWFFIAILGPFFWSISNYLDKFLLQKHLKGIGKEALILYSTIFGLLVLPFAYFLDKNIFNIDISQILILILSGFFNSIAIFTYLSALEDEDTSTVIPFFQIIPIFGFLIGFIILGETLSRNQLISSLLIISGAFILSLEISELKKIKIKKVLFLTMLISSLFFALYESLFKYVAINNSFWISSFWQYLGLFLFGLILFSYSKKYRDDFFFLLKKHDWKLFSINISNESITIIGNLFYNFSLLLAPIALVMTVNGYQPIFVFIEGIVLSIFFPKIIKENTSLKHLLHKSLSIVLVFIGTYMLYNGN